jgi:predicted TIM-barrel fold metal-dependent hydrolase
MLIVDAQVHIWRHGPPTHPAHRQVPVFSTDELLAAMDEAQVEAAVLHPPGWDPTGNELAMEAARQHPERLAILGHFPLDQPESRDLVQGWKQQPGMLGLRFALLDQRQREWWTDGTIDWLWPSAEQAGVPVALLAADHLALVAQVAERHPGLKLLIDHLGIRGSAGSTYDEAAFTNLPQVLALAKYPNVAIKATGAPHYSSQPYPFRNIHPFLRQIFDAFGPDRFFWGTDITRMPCSWRQCVTMFTEEMDWLTESDKELIMGRALCNWLEWHLPTGRAR